MNATHVRHIGHTLRRLVGGTVLLLVCAGAAQAQQVYWENPGPLGVGQRAALDLVFDGAQPSGRVTPPRVDGLSIVGNPSQTSSVSIINGRPSSTLTLSYPVRAEREGRIQVPAFQVETSAGAQTVAPLALEVGAATLPGNGRAAGAKVSDAVQARLTPSNMTPYAGEVVDLDLTVALTAGRHGEVVGTPTWSSPGITAEDWSNGKAINNQRGSAVQFHSRAIAAKPGRLELAPAQQEVKIESGRERFDPFESFGSMRGMGGSDLFDSVFSRGQSIDATVQSNSVQLDVQPLPQPAPAGFSGAVGQFTLESTLTPEHPKTGDPITWTLTLEGNGNLSSVALPARAVPNELRALQPKQRKQLADGALFSGAISEDLVLIPTQPGDLSLEPVRFTYFDPQTGTYETAIAQPPPLHVTGAALAAPQQSAPAVAPAAPVVAAPTTASPATAQAGALPRDPLPGTGSAPAPLAWDHLRLLLAIPIVALVLFWIGLAARQAYRTDPRRPQREALARLRVAIEQARTADGADARSSALLDWQHTAAQVLGVDLAAPTARQLDTVAAGWADAWAGSERALYAPDHALPAGWCERALQLCAPPRRLWLNPLRIVTPRNLLPRFATAALLMLCLVSAAHAAEPLEQYAQGDFAAARDGVLARAQAAPSDWIARYNLGVIDAQLGNAGRAFGETLAAFVRAPRDAAVRWNAALFAAGAPGIEGSPAGLLSGSFAAAAAPATWQIALMLGVLTACLAAAVALHRRYAGAARSWAAVVLFAAGIAGSGTAGAALQRYGTLADPRAAAIAAPTVLRSVPTDATPAQQERPIAAGAVVTVEQDFLGWVRVALASGETGWLRHADLVPLYGPPSA